MNTDLAAQHALDRLKREGIEALTETERTLAAAWLFAAGVGNSGFAGYFSGTRGDLAFCAPPALRAIGAPQLAEIAAEANAVFGVDGPPQSRAARRTFVRALPPSAQLTLDALDRRFHDSEEDIDALLEKFLARNGEST